MVVMVGLFLAFQLDRWYDTQRSQADLQVHLASLTGDFAEYEVRLLSAISLGDEEMRAAIALRTEIRKELADFHAAHELNNLDYAATNRNSGKTRGFDALLPYKDPDMVLEAMKTKLFENIVVIQWETAEDWFNDGSGLLKRVRRIQAMLPTPS